MFHLISDLDPLFLVDVGSWCTTQPCWIWIWFWIYKDRLTQQVGSYHIQVLHMGLTLETRYVAEVGAPHSRVGSGFDSGSIWKGRPNKWDHIIYKRYIGLIWNKICCRGFLDYLPKKKNHGLPSFCCLLKNIFLIGKKDLLYLVWHSLLCLSHFDKQQNICPSIKARGCTTWLAIKWVEEPA